MKKIAVLVLLFVVIGMTSCTENARTRTFGGESTIILPEGTKLINVTWKETDLWYLTRKREPGEKIEEYTFQEKSSFGVWEGTFHIKEQ